MGTGKIIFFATFLLAMTPLVKSQGIDDVKHLIENERYNSAELLLEKSVGSIEPTPEMNYLIVKAYLEQKKIDEASKYVNRHLQSALSTETDPLNRIACARYLLNVGNIQAAEEIFASVFKSRKNQKKPFLLHAMAEVVIGETNGDAREALVWLDKAEKKDRLNPEIDITKGLAYRKLNDASNAFLSFKNAMKKDPENARAYYEMGKIFTAQRNRDAYMQYFTKAYKIDSTYAPVLEELYNYYYFRDVRIAKMYLEKFIANTDHSVQNDYNWTDILYLNGEHQNAIKSASDIITKEQGKTQPRIYKLVAYSYAKYGDSAKAYEYINRYFKEEDPEKVIPADFLLIAQLTEKMEGQEEAAVAYYSIAADMDTVTANKAEYAAAIAELYKKTGNNAKQAEWLGKYYGWKEKANNIDLFNWGVACYMAKDYPMTDSVFTLYTIRYPDDIYGYYWRAQANASMDTNMVYRLAAPHYYKVIEIGEKNKEINKKMLLNAYGYLGGFEANTEKNYSKSLELFEKYQEMEKENQEVNRYIEMLRKWIAERKQEQ